MPGTIVVRGLREVQYACAHTDKEFKKALRGRLREAAAPIAAEIETEAHDPKNIRRIGPRWGVMRIGVTQRLVYIVPKERGARSRGFQPSARPSFGGLMMERVMEPALEHHAPETMRMVERLLEETAADFNRIAGVP